MKKIITLSLQLIIAIFVFSSCSNNLSLTKRHYNKGYYVDSKKMKKSEKLNNDRIADSKTNNETIITHTYTLVAKNNTIKNESYNTSNTKVSENVNLVDTQSKKLKLKTYKPFKELIQASKSNATFIDMPEKKINTNDDDDDHGLSLFWIVILVLLLLWLFGFVFLANALIHLLLILILVLFILWILKII